MIGFGKKSRVTNVLNAKIQPLRCKEDILVFSTGVPNYFPQGTSDCKKQTGTGASKLGKQGDATGKITNTESGTYEQTTTGYPRNIIEFASEGSTQHPTQKPVALCEYLIKTYTNEGMWVLDNTMGSGTTGVACMNTNRNFIGIERDDKYFAIAKQRIEEAKNK